MKVSTFLDEAIEYDPEKRTFFAVVNDKRLEHKSQNRLEKIIAKVKQPKKLCGRPRTRPVESSPPKKRRGRPRIRPVQEAGEKKRRGRPKINGPDGTITKTLTPEDQMKALDAVDIAKELLLANISKYCREGSPVHASLAIRARNAVWLAGDLVKDVINHGQAGK